MTVSPVSTKRKPDFPRIAHPEGGGIVILVRVPWSPDLTAPGKDHGGGEKRAEKLPSDTVTSRGEQEQRA